MRKLIIILTAFIQLAPACQKTDQDRLDALFGHLEELKGDRVPAVPDAVDVQDVPDGDFFFTFEKEKYGVDAGRSSVVEYTLPEESTVEVFAKDGWQAELSSNGTTGTITVTAPDPACYSEIVVTAKAADGRQTADIIPLIVRDPYSKETRPVIEALGYYSFKPWNANLENYQKLADAGITMVTVETDEDDYLYQMDLARAVGIKVLAVIGWATGGWYENMSQERLEKLERLIDSLKDRPELYGYHIYDEPSVDNIFELMAIEDKIIQLDPDHPVYVNLRPQGSSEGMGASTYDQYVEVFAAMMHLKQLSFDMYPALDNGLVQADWHYCLWVVADAARRYNKPFWAFAATCWIDLEQVLIHRAKPTVGNVLLQVYTDLAYGAQTIQYFTIQDYGGTDFAPIMRDGTWTEAYDILKEANLQMQKRAFIFKGSNVSLIRQIGIMATHDTALSKRDLPEEIEDILSGESATVSFVENNGNKYVVIVNNFWHKQQQIAIKVKEPVYYIDSNADFHLCEAGEWGFFIPEGGMLAFKYR